MGNGGMILLPLSAILGIIGFMGAFAVNRLAKSIDGLVASDEATQQQLITFREDMLKNYVRHEDLASHKLEYKQALLEIKQDVIGRVDRMEMAFKEALYAHEHREMTMAFNRPHPPASAG